jgi:hypothetical protein
LNRGLELEIEFAGEVTARAAASPLAAGYCPPPAAYMHS